MNLKKKNICIYVYVTTCAYRNIFMNTQNYNTGNFKNVNVLKNKT